MMALSLAKHCKISVNTYMYVQVATVYKRQHRYIQLVMYSLRYYDCDNCMGHVQCLMFVSFEGD